MTIVAELTPFELRELDGYLALKDGGEIHNVEALDGFFAALICCPDLVKPGEYMPVIESGDTEDGGLAFESLEDAERFLLLVHAHRNCVNYQLSVKQVYRPLLRENDKGEYGGNDWANGFFSGVGMRTEIWSEVIDSEECGGAFVPIVILALEHRSDTDLRSFKEPIDDQERENLIHGAAAGVMKMHAYYHDRRGADAARTAPVVRSHRKTGRNEPCPCGSGRKYKRCCGMTSTLH